jgi:N-dimethylarginine dimethylaminohydrolase
MANINRKILMSDARRFGSTGLNPFSGINTKIDSLSAQREHDIIRDSLARAGVDIVQVPSPADCLDGVYAANWALCIEDTVVYAKLPLQRTHEEPYVQYLFSDDGHKDLSGRLCTAAPYLFSGQGDALPCGNLLFCGQGYRTDPRMHKFLAATFPNMQIISLQTVPVLCPDGTPFINPITQLPDSLFYDLDLALSVLAPDLIAWCPEAFTLESQITIRQLDHLDKIEVSYEEATTGFACNLISTGATVVMSEKAPKLRSAIESTGLATITPSISELAEGGGFIRCVGLTLEH